MLKVTFGERTSTVMESERGMHSERWPKVDRGANKTLAERLIEEPKVD